MLVSQRVNAERIVLLAWSRAILLQIAHPLIAAAIADHSTVRAGFVTTARRLHATVQAMRGLAFGSEAVQSRVTDAILGIHQRVHGHLREPVGVLPAGTPYSAEDPALVLWVHATLMDSTVLVYEALVGEVPPVERDAYCREARPLVVALGADSEAIPRDWESLERYMAEVYASGLLWVGSDARLVSEAVFRGPLPFVSRPVGWAARRLAAGWLPAPIREQFGLPWSPRHERQFRRIVSAVRRVRRLLPRAVAWWPEARAIGDSR